MKKSLLLALLFVLALTNLNVMAQDDEEGWAKDNLEMTFHGALALPSGDIKDWNDSLGAKSKAGLGLEIGYFLSYTFVAGIGFDYHSFNIDNSPTDLAAEGLTHRLYSPYVYLKYYPQLESNFAPYLKAQVGYDLPKFTTFVTSSSGNRYRQVSYDPALAFSIGAGAFYFVHDFGGLYFEGNYHLASSEDITGDFTGTDYTFDAKINYIDLRFGIRIIFGSEE